MKLIMEDLYGMLEEEDGKKDACYHKVKARYKVWPSAYASGALVKCRKVGAKNWGKSKKEALRSIVEDELAAVLQEKSDFSKEKESGLHGWFSRRGGEGKAKGWVDCNTCRDGKCKPCGRSEGEKRAKPPRCRPTPSQCKGYKKPKKESVDMSEERFKEIIIEELSTVLIEKEKTDKERMKCNSPRRIRKGEAGHGTKKFVVKACDGGTEKIIRYGDAKMEIKKDNPARRKSFRARHKCDTPGSKLKARYWSCKKW